MSQETNKIPEHVAVILDGNGRWAKAKGMPRTAGHVAGAKTLEDMCEIVDHKGIKYFTVYVFSTENWKRPPEEVAALMNLLRDYLKTCLKRAMKNNMCVRVIGDKTGLDEEFRKRIDALEEGTKNNTGLHFQLAINYGSRDEITRAVKKLALAAKEDKIDIAAITEQTVSDTLDTAGIPDPDLLIRSCGDQRLSNFLMWQLAYTEFYFTDTPWPDFNEKELDLAIDAYNHRDRRFGGVKEP